MHLIGVESLLYQKSKRQEKVLTVPMDMKIPKIRIATRQANKLANSRIVVRIDSWSVNSQYPDGHFVQELGEIGSHTSSIASFVLTSVLVMNRRA